MSFPDGDHISSGHHGAGTQDLAVLSRDGNIDTDDEFIFGDNETETGFRRMS